VNVSTAIDVIGNPVLLLDVIDGCARHAVVLRSTFIDNFDVVYVTHAHRNVLSV